MNKRSIIVLALILVLIGGGCFVYLSLGAKNKNSYITVAEDMEKVEEGVEQSEKTVSPAKETKVDNQDSIIEKTESKNSSKNDNKNKAKTEKKTVGFSDKKSESQNEKTTEQKTETKTEKRANDTIQQSTEAFMEKRTEVPNQVSTEVLTENKTEAPTEHKTEAPIQQRTEAPTEKRIEATTQAPTEAQRCSHNWVWHTHTETIHHDAVTHTEYYYSDAWDEDVYITKVKCVVCGTYYANINDYYANDSCMGSFGEEQVYDHTIHHEPQVIDSEEIIDQPAYDEYVEVKDYQYCSKCGERK